MLHPHHHVHQKPANSNCLISVTAQQITNCNRVQNIDTINCNHQKGGYNSNIDHQMLRTISERSRGQQNAKQQSTLWPNTRPCNNHEMRRIELHISESHSIKSTRRWETGGSSKMFDKIIYADVLILHV